MPFPSFNIAGITGACCIGARCSDNEETPSTCAVARGIFYPFLSCEEITQCGTQACCFDDRPCADLMASDCLFQGGRTQDVGTQCIGTICVSSVGACCFEDNHCELLDPQDCEDQGGVVQGGPCNPNPCIPIELGACCLPNGRCLSLSGRESCERDGGVFFPSRDCVGLDCPDFPPPPGCEEPDSSEYHRGKIPKTSMKPWSLDLCHSIFLEATPYPTDKFARMFSLNRVRAVDAEVNVFFGEPCGYHWGDYALDDEGFLEGYFCSEPRQGDHSHRQQSRTQTFIQLPESDPQGYIEHGFVAELGTYHAPYWTEVRFDSYQPYCGAPV